MNRIFTLHISKRLKRIFLIVALALAVTANEAFINSNADNFTPLQAKIVKCYPNPAISFVNFEFSTDVLSKSYSLQVYSFTGKKMYETNVSNSKITLLLTNEFYRGLYVYQFTDKSGKILETGKFQVTK